MKGFLIKLFTKTPILIAAFNVSTVVALNQKDAHLQNIVDFGDVLVKSTPSHFASGNFASAFHSNDVKIHNNVDVQATESKTAVFQKSFVTYIKEIYNATDYTATLSRDCSHILEFLALSNELNLNAETVHVCMRLFYNKIKGCELIDDLVVLKLLEALPKQLERHFVVDTTNTPSYDQTFMKHHLEQLIMNKLTSPLTNIQSNTEVFGTELVQEIMQYCQQITATLQKQYSQQEVLQRLRTMIIRFLDITLSKIMWSPNEPEVIVESFIMLGDGLLAFADTGIINNMDDLDDLFWTLNYRFNYFLEVAGAVLPSAFYEDLESALANKAIFFLEYKEQDEAITTKKEILVRQLIQSKAQSLAYDAQGIISMPMLHKGKSMHNDLKIGATYEHYSKKLYKVIGVAYHSETKEIMVVYQGLYNCPEFGENPVWVRPKKMFLEEVTINGVITPRFKLKQTQVTQ